MIAVANAAARAKAETAISDRPSRMIPITPATLAPAEIPMMSGEASWLRNRV